MRVRFQQLVVWAAVLCVATGRSENAPLVLKGPGGTLAFGRAEKGAVVSVQTKGGAELAAKAKQAGLFSLSVSRQVWPADKLIVLSSRDAAAYSAATTHEAGGTCATLTYEGFTAGVARVVCMVRMRPDDTMARWGIRVEMQEGWALDNVQYPCVTLAAALGESDEDDAAVIGTAKGGVIRKPGALPVRYKISSTQPGALAAAFGCYYDDRAGFYTAAEDPEGYPKGLELTRTVSGMEFSWSRPCYGIGVETQAYDVVTAVFEGADGRPTDWRDAADLYKAWALTQPWCATPFARRDDLPAWLREGAATALFGRDWLAEPARIERWVTEVWLKRYPKMPLITSYWGWEKRGIWVTPDYFPVFPTDEQFTNLVAKMRRFNCHAFPWPSGYHWTLTYNKRPDGSFEWDDRARFDETARSHAVHNRDGSLYIRTPGWLNGGSTACLCGGAPWTIRWWNEEICVPLARRGCELVQVDQMVGANWPACYAPGHGHHRGRGLWMTESFTRQLLTMRETMRKWEPDSVVCFEEPNERYNHIVGLQDYRDCRSKYEWASVFNYLYHEFLPLFQSNPPRSDRVFAAHCAADGQMPYVVPSESDFAGEALANGGFEALKPGEDALRGWGRVRGYQGKVWTGQSFVDTEEKYSGASSLRLENTNRDDIVQVAQNISVTDCELSQGVKYRLSAWLKTERMAQPAVIRFSLLASGFTSVGQEGALAFPAAGSGWTQVSADFTVPPGAETLRLMCNARGEARVWVDDVTLEAVRPDGGTQEVRNSGRSVDARFLEKWAALYHGEGRPWLLNGCLLHPPKLTCATFGYRGRQTPAVFHNAFQAPDGETAVVLANATRIPQAVNLTWRGKTVALTLDGSGVMLVR